MKKLSFLILCTFLILTSYSKVIAESSNVTTKTKIYINNQLITFKSPIQIKNNELMLPLGETMAGLDISFDEIECRKTSFEGYTDINIDVRCDIGNIWMNNETTRVWVSGDNLDLNVPPLIYKDTVYVPLMFISDVLGKKVIRDNKNSTIYISDIVLPEPQGWIRLKNRPSGNERISITLDSTVPGIGSVGFKTNYLYKAVSINGKIYMIDNDGTLKQYDPATDVWVNKSKISELKNSNGNFKLAVLKGKILIIGVNCSDIYQYDIETNKCEFLTSFPIEQIPASVIVAEGKVYILSGMYAGDPNTLNTLDMYDPLTDTWTKKKDMFQGLSDLTAVYYNGKIYIFGGVKSTTKLEDLLEKDPVTGEMRFKPRSNTNEYPGQNIEAYDIKTDTWSYITPDNLHWFASGAELCNGKLYLFGDEYINGNVVNSVKEYDPVNNKFTKVADMLPKKDSYSTVAVNGEIFVISGKSVEKYIPGKK